MEKLIKFLISKIKYIVIFYFLLQIGMILTLDTYYKSDALYYYQLAKECIDQNEFYPAQNHLYEDYIVAPLYINAIILLLKLYDSTVAISLFNLFIILLQIFFLYKITLSLFSETTARLTILIYIIYLNTLGMMIQNYTELFFLLLITCSIYFYYLNKNIYFILSGLFIGAAIAVRPIGWALLLAMISIQVLSSIKSREVLFKFFYFYAGILIFIILFGSFTLSHFGKFEFASTTGPVNLLIGANDNATGGFNSELFEKNNAGYIQSPESLTYIQKGEFYQHKAIEWISENPIKWLSLAPLKLLHSFGWDDIALTSLLGYENTNFLKVLKVLFTERDINKALPNTSLNEKVFYSLVLVIYHLFYYLLLIAMSLGTFNLFKQKLNSDSTNLLLLFSLFASLMIMITVGTPRYKYPMFILMLPFAAYYLEMKIKFRKQNLDKA